jgi:hypothetical protein
MTPRFALLAALLLAGAAALAAADPAPTPTPEPRLTGGFGKAAAPPARKQVERKGVRITNDSLVTDPQKGKLTTSQRVATPVPSGSAARTPGARTPAVGPTPTPGAGAVAEGDAPPARAGEDYWRNEARLARERVADLKETIARLEADTRKMEADFYSWDDGAYRDGVIKPAWDKAREDLATARQELPLAERALAELPDRARKAGALPGWLRE